MLLHPNEVYHVYNRGNNRKRLFYEVENYAHFTKRIRDYISPHCDLLAYCLLPNHFHLLVHGNELTSLPYDRTSTQVTVMERNPLTRMSRFSHGVQILLSSYAKTINKRHKRTGSLFTQNTHAKQTSSEWFLSDYTLWCFIYIHNNPVTAGLVSSPEKWKYSSYNEYLGKVEEPLCNLELGRSLLSLNVNGLSSYDRVEVPDFVIDKIF